jgi:ABC-type molybdate transport system permease subunit
MFSGFPRSSGIVSSETAKEVLADRRSQAVWVTFLVTTVSSCIWFMAATFIAYYAVIPDQGFPLLIFFLLSLPCSVPLAGVAVILGRCVSLFRYSRILSTTILVGSVLWLLQFTIETRMTSELAWESEEFTGIDDTSYVFTLFGLPPLVFGSCLFAFMASSVSRRTNKNGFDPQQRSTSG